jgi:negative regulator of flagellin synthesis FlgM
MVDKINSAPTHRPELVRNDASKRNEAASESRATPGTSAAQANAEAAPTVKATGSQSTSVSSLIERAKAAAEHVPEVDRQKVDDIKQAIARGEFQVNPKAVAQAFVSMTLNATRM